MVAKPLAYDRCSAKLVPRLWQANRPCTSRYWLNNGWEVVMSKTLRSVMRELDVKKRHLQAVAKKIDVLRKGTRKKRKVKRRG
jgi:hypothetical protein